MSQPIRIIVCVFANSPGNQGLIPGRVIPKTQKMVLDASLPNTQNYKVWINSKLSNPVKGVVAIEKGAFGLPLTMVGQFTLICICKYMHTHTHTHTHTRIYIYMHANIHTYTLISIWRLSVSCPCDWQSN